MSDIATVQRTALDARGLFGVPRAPRRVPQPSVVVEALACNYPIVAAILGRAPFHDLACEFVAAVPPDGPALAAYGDVFPEWIVGRNIGRVLPYLSAVASIDRLQLASARAPADAPVAPAVIADMTAEQWSSSRARLHAATRFGWFAVPAPSIWLAHFAPHRAEVTTEWQAEGILITRPAGTVRARRIGPSEHRILSGLRIGETIGAASAAAHALYSDADITGAVHAILDSGAVATLRPSR
ncbi:HvfC/BufC family peptide modification chaperone [Sphingopyxis solisilvae]|uniref:HvfC/BufC family peptide modification chaperone n=1 Tax=Sphingopyxis solisilvae TaxID=1886788 RepID=UPI001892A4F1|nr:putative DNA-binding domain-containing protein [Sphingopyxis solisilvae]